MRTIGLHHVALVHAGHLVVRAGEVAALCRRRERGSDPFVSLQAVHHDRPPAPWCGILAERIAPARQRGVDVPRREPRHVIDTAERIRALVTDELLVGGQPRPIDAPASEVAVGPGAPIEHVPSTTSAERVVAALSPERVVPLASGDDVVTLAAEELVTPLAADDRVVAGVAADRVDALAPHERVVARAAVEHRSDPRVARDVDRDGVVAGATGDANHFHRALQTRAHDHAVHQCPQLPLIFGAALDEDHVVGPGGIGVAGDGPGAAAPAHGQREPSFERLERGENSCRRVAASGRAGGTALVASHREPSLGRTSAGTTLPERRS